MTSQQLLIDQDVIITKSRKHAGTIVEHTLSEPGLMILEFGWKVNGSRFHLYRKHGVEWNHLAQANEITAVIQKAQDSH